MEISAFLQTKRRAVRRVLLQACLGALAVHLPMAVDGQGISGAPYTFTTLAGVAGGYGTNDGIGGAARFDSPAGVALDPNGNVFVADTQGYTVREVTPAGLVTG